MGQVEQSTQVCYGAGRLLDEKKSVHRFIGYGPRIKYIKKCQT